MNRISILALGAMLLSSAALAAAPQMGSASGMIALNSLPNPPATLASANVVDAKGTMVGAVQKVVMDVAGHPATVDVALLGSGAIVQIGADQFNYDQGHNLLTAQLDASQIAAEPRAPG